MNHKENLKRLFLKGVEAVKPENFEFEHIEHKNIYLFGSGKAAISMSKAFIQQNITTIKESFVVSNYHEEVKDIEVFVSSHPTPSTKSIIGARELKKRLSKLTKSDFFVYMLSGGTSALIEEPIEPISLDALSDLTNKLLLVGATIDEINIVRKHLSFVKGGRLGVSTKASGIVYVISDVIGDDLQTIGSAPFYFDTSTCLDAKSILIRYDLWEKVDKSIQNVINLCNHETPKKENSKIKHKIIASNTLALDAIKKEAFDIGYDAKIVTHKLYGDVHEVAKKILQTARDVQSDRPLCLLFGGESTVKVKGNGKGGRNQELALWVLKELKKGEKYTFLSAGTDGIDGMSDSAGAIVDEKDKHNDIDIYLQNSDSHHYHKHYNTLLTTAQTGTNVMDIMILIKDEYV